MRLIERIVQIESFVTATALVCIHSRDSIARESPKIMDITHCYLTRFGSTSGQLLCINFRNMLHCTV